MFGREEVGSVQSLFVNMHDREKGPLCFRLAGRAWEVEHIDWGKGTLRVQPAERGKVPSWMGMPNMLSFELCQAMRDVLVNPGGEARWLSPAAEVQLGALREGYAEVLSGAVMPIEESEDGVRSHTFAGGAVNRLLAVGLEAHTGKRWIAGNLSVHAKEAAFTEANAAVRALPGCDWEGLAAGAAGGMARGPVTKFQPCLPDEAEQRLLAERFLDVRGTEALLSSEMEDRALR